MKILNIALIFCFIGSTAFVEVNRAEKIFQQLKQKKEVFSMSLSKDITDFFDMDADFNGKEKLISGDFKKGSMLIVENIGDAETVKNIFLKENYHWIEPEEEETMDDGEAYLFVDKKGPNVSEVHLVFVGEEKTVVLTIYGDIHVKNKK